MAKRQTSVDKSSTIMPDGKSSAIDKCSGVDTVTNEDRSAESESIRDVIVTAETSVPNTVEECKAKNLILNCTANSSNLCSISPTTSKNLENCSLETGPHSVSVDDQLVGYSRKVDDHIPVQELAEDLSVQPKCVNVGSGAEVSSLTSSYISGDPDITQQSTELTTDTSGSSKMTLEQPESMSVTTVPALSNATANNLAEIDYNTLVTTATNSSPLGSTASRSTFVTSTDNNHINKSGSNNSAPFQVKSSLCANSDPRSDLLSSNYQVRDPTYLPSLSRSYPPCTLPDLLASKPELPQTRTESLTSSSGPDLPLLGDSVHPGTGGGRYASHRSQSEETSRSWISDVVMRRNRYNLDMNNDSDNVNRRNSGENNSSFGFGGRSVGGVTLRAPGVLLPKRRSTDDKCLSKENIEATLNEADDYWKRTYGW